VAQNHGQVSSSAARLLSPEEIAVRAGGDIPFLRFPERSTVFGEREMRLRQLAVGHAMGDYLLFIAELAKAQAEVLNATADLTLPDAAQIESAAKAGTSLLAATEWKRDPRWTRLLRDLLGRVDARLRDGPARTAVRALVASPDATIDAQSDRLLAGVMLGLDMASAPLVAAGLQTYFTHLVIATQAAASRARLAPFGRIDDQTVCPCCGSKPTASITRIGAEESGYRYLACSLCSTQWHMVRIKCARCLNTKGIAYQSLRLAGEADTSARGDAVEGASTLVRAVEAECCDACHHYLKIVHMERDPEVEPIADDLASLTLDLLASDAGETRHGVNLMLVFGDPDVPDGGGG
jgi:FdhE protein